MVKKFFMIFGIMLLAGCATTRGQTPMTQLQVRVGELERQLDNKDDAIRSLNHEIQTLTYKVDSLDNELDQCQSAARRTARPVSAATAQEDDEGIIRVAADTSDVQRALSAAGFYSGAIDGKIGALTQKAISDFQKSKGLKVDGIVGDKTWTALQGYLE